MAISNNLELHPQFFQTGAVVTLNHRVNEVRYYTHTQNQVRFDVERSATDTLTFPNGQSAVGFQNQRIGATWVITSTRISATQTNYVMYLTSQPILGVGKLKMDNRATTNVNANPVNLVGFQSIIPIDVTNTNNLFNGNINRVKPIRRGIIQVDAWLDVTSPGAGAIMSFTLANSATDFYGNRVYVSNLNNTPRGVHLQYVYEELGEPNANGDPVAKAYVVVALREAGSTTAAVNLGANSIYLCKYLYLSPDPTILL